MHNLLFPISVTCLVILLLMVVLKKFSQPHLLAYIIAGILLGPYVSGILTDRAYIWSLGELGILFLMFFLGMEIHIPDSKSLLLKPLIVQGIKMVASIVFVLLMGQWQGWSMGSIMVITALLIFNSTAVVTEFMRKKGELYAESSKTVLNTLLLQDIMLAPVLTLFQFAGNRHPGVQKLLLSVVGCWLIFLLLRAIRNRNLFQLPVIREMEGDHELQVFAGILICVGFAEIASLASLPGTIGSFAAGLFIGRTKAFHWLENVLKPFKIFFVSLFFVSVGLSLDLHYLKNNYAIIMLITVMVFIINNLASAIVFRLLRHGWRESIYVGGLLSQAGEFGIVACSLAYEMGIIPMNLFKAGLTVTGLSLLCSTLWISIVRKFIYDPIRINA
jgi:CPA2 family monovalent cation:H+ antiporter-2